MSFWYAKRNFISVYIVKSGFLNDIFWMFLLSDMNIMYDRLEISGHCRLLLMMCIKSFYDSVYS